MAINQFLQIRENFRRALDFVQHRAFRILSKKASRIISCGSPDVERFQRHVGLL